MIKAVMHTRNYFQAPAGYFWQWADNGEVVEWAAIGTTICYRDELIAILKELSVKGMPPLSSLLLLLASCKNEFAQLHEKFVLKKIMVKFNDPNLEPIFNNALTFLQIVSQLPAELKTGNQRVHLIHEVFGQPAFLFSGYQLKESLDELASGRIDTVFTEPGEEITKEQFTTHFQYLSDALRKFPDVETLSLKLKTGLHEVPLAAKIEEPTPVPADLFEQLAQDEKTIGIARLAQRLVPVLNIPMHLQGSGEQTHGGISDITNRGNYDRLLLSELANDDMLLMARLVNNEALYFRREEPPVNPKRKRTLLLDATIRMWGIPRVFAIAAALAFARNSKHSGQVESYMLKGDEYKEVSLTDKQGVISSLEILHHALHCGHALHKIINDLPHEEQNEYILVTEAQLFNDPGFHACLSLVKPSLSFVITVSRDGQLQFFGCVKGNIRLLNTAVPDLNELLLSPADPIQTLKSRIESTPAFLSCRPAPLFFPKVRIGLIAGRIFIIPNAGLLAINKNQRVLFFTNSEKGAIELLNYIDKGRYTLGCGVKPYIYLLVHNQQRNLVKLYKINIDDCSVISNDLPFNITCITDAVFIKDDLYIRTDYETFLLDCISCEVVEKKDYNGFTEVFSSLEKQRRDGLLPEQWQQFLGRNLYQSIMYKMRDVFISDDNKLVLGNYTLELIWNNSFLRIHENVNRKTGNRYGKLVDSGLKILNNRHIKYAMRVWKDGSQAIIDSRGLLHLKSSDTRLPEITIVLVTGMETAAWASNGTACGASYFVNEQQSRIIQVNEFYSQYIQPFIDRLI